MTLTYATNGAIDQGKNLKAYNLRNLCTMPETEFSRWSQIAQNIIYKITIGI
jgi:hypothetical protein